MGPALHYPSLEKGEEEEEKSEQWRANVVARVVGKYRLTCGTRPYIKSHAQLYSAWLKGGPQVA